MVSAKRLKSNSAAIILNASTLLITVCVLFETDIKKMVLGPLTLKIANSDNNKFVRILE